MYSSASQIALRMLTYGEKPADEALIRRRIESAIAFRESLAIDATAYRLVHGEADLLPSLIVDRYGDYLVVQALSQGMDRLLPAVVAALNDLLHPRGILARNDPRTRVLEGLEQRVEVLSGEVPETVAVTRGRRRVRRRSAQRPEDRAVSRSARESGGRGAVRARTAARLFQLPRRVRARARPAVPRRRSRSTSRKTPSPACARTPRRNGVAVDARVGNVFDELRGLERLGERFDTIVLDPPAFAKNKASVAKAAAGYKEINLRALKLLNPGGTLVTCSCSYNISEAAFAEIVYEAAVDAQVPRDGRREADAGPRSSGAARRAGDVLPEVLHPPKARGENSLKRSWPPARYSRTHITHFRYSRVVLTARGIPRR